MRIILIAAIGKNNVIGKADGSMPWHDKEEFQHFKNTTFGYPILMGRKTYNTLGKPLKGRLNIIITRDKKFSVDIEETKVFNSVDDGLEHCRKINSEKVFIIGGGEIYKQTISIADELIISVMDLYAEGEIFFPAIEQKVWALSGQEKRTNFEILKYKRS